MQTERTETDSFGTITLPTSALWGAHTQRSLHYFAIGHQRMPGEIIEAMAWLKWAAAKVNADLHLLDATRAAAIAQAAEEVARGGHRAAFPLSVWQTGSGTQSHMNLNEVLANLATRRLQACAPPADGEVEPVRAVHPNDEVNLGQSSNDVFPSAMHIAAVLLVQQHLLPALLSLHQALIGKATTFAGLVKIGRTHLQDATPVTLGQEFGGYAAQLAQCEQGIAQALPAVCALAIGGTAVGTGLNTHPEFGARVCVCLSGQLNQPFVQASNLFAAMAGHEALVALHASLKNLAVALNKIGSDLRLLGSGPRAGLGELLLPQNEAGSSIMPGKVNPTQVEALVMVCAQVMGHDLAIGMASAQGQLELNTCKPLIALNVLDSITLLADAMRSFARHCVVGIEVNHERIAANVQASLMLATALTPHIGYDNAARIARRAQAEGTSLREAALGLGLVSAADFDRWVDPGRMLGPG